MSNFNSVIVLDNVEYCYMPYRTEIQTKNNNMFLQQDVENNFKHIFKNMTLIKKLRIIPPDSGYRIPDFYAIDIDEKKLYVVEVELFKHGGPGHIIPQINDFDRILKEEPSRNDLIVKINKELKKNPEELEKLFHNLDAMETLTEICNNYQIVVIIDEIDSRLQKALEPYNVIILQFKKYKRTDANIFIYEMETLKRKSPISSSIPNNNANKNLVKLKRITVKYVVPLGQPIYMKYKGNIYTVRRELGGIRLEDGSIEPTLLLATKKITGWKAADVWKNWFLDRECTKSIDSLRVVK